MTKFQISTGLISINDACVGVGYAGQPPHVNDPNAIEIHGIGPLPSGSYDIQPPIDSPHTGLYSLPLIPDSNNAMFGRSGFLIHGPNATKDANGQHNSSNGCIVIDRMTRVAIWADPDNKLIVVQ